ncbi:RNA polymerase factor sigma-54 [Colwellia sp. 39_35_sub15_T18]|nr:RNA polymerase factor sigma-54 [Colwellia sp. 39_35_sub15_T18]
MRPSLQLRIGQQLTMTPQLQQAIKLLQLSTLELQQEIQEVLESNPLLEVNEDSPTENNENNSEKLEEAFSANTNSTEQTSSEGNEEASTTIDEMSTTEALAQNDIPEELNIDTTWEESYSAGVSNTGAVSSPAEDFTYQGETSDSIQDHLLWQMELTPFSETDRTVAIAIIEAVDDAGYLTVSCEDILDSVGIEGLELDEVEVVLKRINVFDPIGVAAASIADCLIIQLNQFDDNTPYLKESKHIISEHIDLLGNRDYRQLMRKTKLKEDQLREVMRLIQTLNPRPGDAVIKGDDQYVIPDVSVDKKNGRWIVELNPDTAPKLAINKQYAAMTKTTKSSTDDGQFIRSNLQEAKWFIKSLESRNDTLLKVSNCIVQRQQGFLEHGAEAMRPMVLNDIAEAVDMHESTISRVTTQKYMHTPRGIFELKYFFSSHVSTENGGECSSTAIRSLIKKLILAETPAKPLSDSKMADLLAEQGINVARRTIAKYRESLSIPPSNQRKSLL